MLIEIRFHGRGGQGSVVASNLLASAFFIEGKYVQSFPVFGVERRGAPVTAYLRVSEKQIFLRTEIYEPDHVVVLDPTLIPGVDVIGGLKEGGTLLINSPKKPTEFDFAGNFILYTVDANKIAFSHGLGLGSMPIVNTTILGAFAKVTGLVSIDSISSAAPEHIPIKVDENILAAKEAFNSVVSAR